MKFSKFLTLLSLAIIFLNSCKTLQIEKPIESYTPSKLNPTISEFPLNVVVDIKKLENSVNKKMNGLLFEGTNLNNQDLSVKVWKVQNFSISINNNVIEYKVPLKVWSRFAWKVEKFGVSVGDYYEANGSISLSFKTTINIDKNWKIVSTTTSSGYQWLETPKLNIVGVNIPVTPIANIALSKSNKLITTQIDESLAQMIELKKYTKMAWDEAQKPMQISKENDLWVRITPKDVFMSPFNTTGQKLNFTVSIHGTVESFMGAQPSLSAKSQLPDFKFRQQMPQQFNLNIATDATFNKITEMAKAQLVNKTFSQDKKSITITDLSVYGSNGKAIFVTDVIGSLKGRIYFTGNMVYNQQNNSIEITNPAFDIKTSNALVKSANWLLNGMILKQISPYLTYNIKEDIDKLTKETNTMLKNYIVMDGVSLQGKINSITVNSLELVPGAIRVMVNAKGNIGLKLDEMNF